MITIEIVADVLKKALDNSTTPEEVDFTLALIGDLAQAFLAEDKSFDSYAFFRRAQG